MSFLGLVVLVAALVPLLTGGSYRRLAEAPWRWGGLLALGLGLQLLLDTGIVSRSAEHTIGFGILVASYVLLVGFCAGNVLVRGMAVVLVGVALNAFVVTIDQGMPVKIPPDWQTSSDRVSTTVKHHPRVAGDHLLGLTDIIVLRKVDAVISFGDLIIAFGLVDVTYWASRKTRKSRMARRLPAPEPERLESVEPVAHVDVVDVIDVVEQAQQPETLEPKVDAAAAAREAADRPELPVVPTPRRPARTRAPRSRQPVRVGGSRRREPEPAPEPEPATRSGAGGSTAAIKEALERLERP